MDYDNEIMMPFFLVNPNKGDLKITISQGSNTEGGEGGLQIALHEMIGSCIFNCMLMSSSQCCLILTDFRWCVLHREVTIAIVDEARWYLLPSGSWNQEQAHYHIVL